MSLASRRRAGFTLLETLIAAALTAGVLAAVMQSISLVYQVDRTSGTDLDRALIAAAVFDRVAIDLASVVAPVEVTQESDLLVDSDEPQDAEAADVAGVFSGSSDTLYLSVQPPLTVSERLAAAAALGGAGFDASGVGPATRLVEWSTETDDSAAVSRSSVPDGSGGWVEVTVLEVPEVVALSLRYDRGGEVFEEWDDVATGQLPDLVEATLTLRLGEVSSTHSRWIEVPAGRFPVPEPVQ